MLSFNLSSAWISEILNTIFCKQSTEVVWWANIRTNANCKQKKPSYSIVTNRHSVNENMIMSTGHRDGQCNLEPDGGKSNFTIKPVMWINVTWCKNPVWANFRGKPIIILLLITIKQYQFSLMYIFADCTIPPKELNMRRTSSLSNTKEI